METRRAAEDRAQGGTSSTALALRSDQAGREPRPSKRSAYPSSTMETGLFEAFNEAYWKGYAAFQFTQEQDQFHVIGDEKDTNMFTVDDEEVPTQPTHLCTTRWGHWGYSTWCADIDDAITEAAHSSSSGWKRIPGMTHAQLKET